MKIRTHALVGFAFAASCSIASAQGVYFGAHVGQVKSDIGDDFNRQLQPFFSRVNATIDDEDTGYKVLVGYRFNSYFAIEGGYGDYGGVSLNVSTQLPAAQITGDAETKAWLADVVGTFPLGERFGIYAKLGAARWEVKTNATNRILGGPISSGSEKDTGTSFKWTVGASYTVTKNFAVRAEYEQFKAGESNKTGKGDVSLLSLGIVYQF